MSSWTIFIVWRFGKLYPDPDKPVTKVQQFTWFYEYFHFAKQDHTWNVSLIPLEHLFLCFTKIPFITSTQKIPFMNSWIASPLKYIFPNKSIIMKSKIVHNGINDSATVLLDQKLNKDSQHPQQRHHHAKSFKIQIQTRISYSCSVPKLA